MQEPDFDDFTELLDGTCSLLSRGAYRPNAASAAIFFNALKRYPLSVVRQALEAHIADPARGKFVPVPADVIAQIEGAAAADGRPEADEAWGVALRGRDEAVTIVWTSEIAEAWGACLPVLQAGDEVGARLAFKAAYQRLVAAARAERRPAEWSPTFGFDQKLRHEAVLAAVECGRLPAAYLPAPVGNVAGLLELSKAAGCPADVAAKLQSMRAEIVARGDTPGADAVEKQRTQQAQAALAQQLGSASLHGTASLDIAEGRRDAA